MFHGPAEEVWRGLHTQINLLVQPREERRRWEVKALRVPPEELRVKPCAQGLVLSPAVSPQQRQGHGGSATSCTRSDGLGPAPAGSAASSQSPRQLSALRGRIWPRVTGSCEMAGRTKGEEEKGDYSPSSVLRWAPALCWGSGTVAWLAEAVLYIQPSTSHPGKSSESSGQEQGRKEDDPAANTPRDYGHIQLCLRILLETFIQHSCAGHGSLHRAFPAAAQEPGTNSGPRAAQDDLQSTHPPENSQGTGHIHIFSCNLKDRYSQLGI